MNTQPINTPDRARGDEPAELDPGMVEKAREALWETFGAWPSGPLAAWLTEQDCERLARAALSAANVPGLVERLHDAELNVEGEAARATSAEQEVERLRAASGTCYSDECREPCQSQQRRARAELHEARAELAKVSTRLGETRRALADLRAAIRALHQPRTYPSPDHSTAMVTYCVGCDEATGGHPCNTLALLAGLGEQPGCAEHAEDARPAPVVPDSRGLRERVRGVLTDAARRESFSGTDIDALTDAVLAVVGQGVTAEDEECAPDCDERAACDKTGLGHSMCGRCEHGEPRHHGEHSRCAAVRSGEKEG